MQAKDVMDTEGCGTDEIALQGETVAIAHGHLQHGLDSVMGQDGGRRQRRHMGLGAGPIGHVDRIGQTLQAAGPGQYRGRGGAIGRRCLRRHDEGPAAQKRFQPAARPGKDGCGLGGLRKGHG